ncbi:MAG: hypothetical protein Q4G46_02590 [Propionibacteriaceae bacterium]|nr:hypothetical protein [Propionibacteriaceae bacterium]
MTSALPTDIAVGLLGLRTFRIREDGYLLPVTFNADDDWAEIPESWSLGYCIARCRRSRYDAPALHEAPAEACRCGIYSWNTLSRLQQNYREHTDHVVAVVALEGQTIEGTSGFRSQAARIVALWLNERLVPADVCRAVRTTYAGVPIHRHRTTMIRRLLSDQAALSEPPRAPTVSVRPSMRLRQVCVRAVSAVARNLTWALWWLVPAVALGLLVGVLRDETARLIAGIITVLGLTVPPVVLEVIRADPTPPPTEETLEPPIRPIARPGAVLVAVPPAGMS